MRICYDMLICSPCLCNGDVIFQCGLWPGLYLFFSFFPSLCMDIKHNLKIYRSIIEYSSTDKKASYPSTFAEWFKTSRLHPDEEQMIKGSFEQELKAQGEKTKVCLTFF